MDSKVSPLAMLTQACHKIESNMMGATNKSSHSSPKRSRSDDEESASSPSAKQAKLTPPPRVVSQPLSSSEKRGSSKTPERRPSSSSNNSTSATSVPAPLPPTSLTRGGAAQPFYPPLAAMLPPGYPLVPPHAPVTSFDPSSFLMGIPPASLNLLSLMQQQQPPPPSAAAPPATPYICNWMSSGEFCGKRFNTVIINCDCQ